MIFWSISYATINYFTYSEIIKHCVMQFVVNGCAKENTVINVQQTLYYCDVVN